ncbi:Nucleoside 5-triphosphatase RdgB (dHAPTP, dITP, XTP-specific) [hydrothermal vent metagenome]|uniref:dITP/XTP pyrophosphatase n=1 Tax=hydrothermal vent metagenome TaxID=652676 RepID=A0A3B0YM38_9ZZZZ
MKKIVLASNNGGKLREMNQILQSCALDVVPLSDFSKVAPEETGLTFVENAIIKARHACKVSGFPSIADDSGLEVSALQGAPGIYSARYAGRDASDTQNLEKLLEVMINVDQAQRQARFQCLMVYMRHELDPVPLIVKGTWEGFISREPQGNNGFGYDPIFYVPEKKCHSAELEATVKNNLSHRGQALNQLAAAIQKIAE